MRHTIHLYPYTSMAWLRDLGVWGWTLANLSLTMYNERHNAHTDYASGSG